MSHQLLQTVSALRLMYAEIIHTTSHAEVSLQWADGPFQATTPSWKLFQTGLCSPSGYVMVGLVVAGKADPLKSNGVFVFADSDWKLCSLEIQNFSRHFALLSP